MSKKIPVSKCHNLSFSFAASSSEKRFPYLNTKQLSEEEKRRLIGTLVVDSEKIMQKFVLLVSTICNSLKERNIPVAEIALLLNNSHIELSKDLRSIAEALVLASKYWSFFNYRIFETLVAGLGDDNDQERLAAYISDFRQYCKRRLCEVPIDALECDRKVKTRLHVKTDKHFDVPTDDIDSLTVKLSELLGTSLLLLKIEDGCIELDFDYLKEENLLPLLSGDHSDTFMQLGITKLYTDAQVFYNRAVEQESQERIKVA